MPTNRISIAKENGEMMDLDVDPDFAVKIDYLSVQDMVKNMTGEDLPDWNTLSEEKQQLLREEYKRYSDELHNDIRNILNKSSKHVGPKNS